MSVFDPESFMETSTEEAASTKPMSVPTCETLAVIEDVKPREVNTRDGAKVIADLFWSLLDDELKSRLDRDKITVRQSLWLDFTEDGALDFSGDKNWRLGQVREAVGQNAPGEPWSFAMLKGAGPALVHVKEDESGQYPSEVDRVAPAPY